MQPDPTGFYQIIREPLFDAQLKQITNNHKRMAELDQGIDWALARFDPDEFEDIILFQDGFYMWVTDEFVNIDIPQVTIVFRVDEPERTITLISIGEV